MTDAKALYDSYHRESLVSSVTDRRVSLEIRVVKEQMQSLEGNLRWVSSERQLADGLTKESTRQFLSDRLRHSKIKFLWDPNYVVAKKKSLTERTKNLEESSQAGKKKTQSRTSRSLPTVDEHITETCDVEKNDLIHDEIEAKENVNLEKNDLTPEQTFVPEYDPGNAYVAATGAATYDLRMPSSFGSKLVFGGCFCYMTAGAEATSMEMEENFNGGSILWSYFGWFALCCVAFVVGYFLRGLGEKRRLCEAAGRLAAADRTASAMSILVPRLQQSLDQAQQRILRLQSAYEEASDNYDKIAQAYNDAINHGGDTPVGFRTAFTELNELRALHDDAIRIMGRAIRELEFHMDNECPHHMAIFVTNQNPTRWHSNLMYPGIPEGSEVQHIRPCPNEHCAERWTTPWIPDESGESLLTQMESFIEDAHYAAEFQR